MYSDLPSFYWECLDPSEYGWALGLLPWKDKFLREVLEPNRSCLNDFQNY